jgi:hypothetical protein
VRFGNPPVLQRSSFCRRCNFKCWVFATNSQAGEIQVINYVISAL